MLTSSDLINRCLLEKSLLPIVTLAPKLGDPNRFVYFQEIVNQIQPVDVFFAFIFNNDTKLTLEHDSFISRLLEFQLNVVDMDYMKTIKVNTNLSQLYLLDTMGYERWDEVLKIISQLDDNITSTLLPMVASFLKKKN